jgi:hypothetical protein
MQLIIKAQSAFFNKQNVWGAMQFVTSSTQFKISDLMAQNSSCKRVNLPLAPSSATDLSTNYFKKNGELTPKNFNVESNFKFLIFKST